MIYDHLDHLSLYSGLSPRLDTAIQWLLQSNLEALPLGRTDIGGDDVFVNVFLSDSRAPEDAEFEIHSLYDDLQLVLDGQERFEVACGDFLPTQAYDADRDAAFGAAPIQCGGVLDEQHFAIFFVGEAHRPALLSESFTKVKKAVIKIRH
ncbi:MAG: YhcH/YjgK/YiaL family protein [Myxococcales bacterium]|nr:YhcH/YjgK/YiaL family protein [Myxococcales bacterium]